MGYPSGKPGVFVQGQYMRPGDTVFYRGMPYVHRPGEYVIASTSSQSLARLRGIDRDVQSCDLFLSQSHAVRAHADLLRFERDRLQRWSEKVGMSEVVA